MMKKVYLFTLRHKKSICNYMILMSYIFITNVYIPEGYAAIPGEKNLQVTVKKESIEEKWGVKIKWIRLSAAGYMLDFRYRVVDPVKAKPIFKRQTKPHLIHQASGAKFIVPTTAKLGPIRNSNTPKTDRTYFMFFANPARYVKAGNKVTVVIGDFKAEDLIVEK